MKFLVITISCILMLACGKDSRKGSTSGSYTISSEGQPFSYVMTAQDCNSDFATTEAQIDIFENGDYVTRRIPNLPNKKLDESITLGGEFEINIGRVTSLFQKKDPTSFNYCVSEETSKNDKSFENAALSVLYPIRKFSEEFKSLLWHLDIPKVNIQVLPKYSRIVTTKEKRKTVTRKSYLINNAMYFGSQDTLIFLPQGKRDGFKVPFGNVPLWKSPAVVMHEYGHHLFKHVVIKGNDNMVGHGDTELCLDTRDFNTVEDSNEARFRPIVTKEDALGAINEGFADLFAFYSAGEKTFFENMGCMEKTRDLQSDRFLSLRKKILNKSVLEEFVGQPNKVQLSCDLSVNFQDPHMIGAIIAHGFYKLLESSRLSSYYKLQATLLWLQDLRSLYNISSGPEDLIKKSTESFFEKIDDYTGNTKLNCEEYNRVFPIINLNC